MILTKNETCLYILKNAKSLKNIDDKTKEDLAKYGSLITIESKKSITDEIEMANKVYLLAEGRIFLSYIENDGRKIILDDLDEGNFFGDLDFFSENRYKNESLFIEPFPKTTVKICEFRKEDFLSVLSQNPKISIHIISSLSHRVFKSEKKIEELALYNLKAKILSELIELGESSNQTESKVKLNFKISHEKLAQTIGAVRETVSKSLSELKKEGFVLYDNKRNLVINFVRRKNPRDHNS